LWAKLEGAYWFLPGTILVAAIALTFLTLELDRHVRYDLLSTIPWIYLGGPEGARTVLSTIAGSTITVTGVIFSTVIVALSIASSQFGPRLLSNFMRDNSNQAVLGLFLGTFSYCLLILRTVRSVSVTNTFIPYISVTFGILLALASMVGFLFFVHHVSVSINADYLVDLVGHDLERSVDRSYPDHPAGQDHPQTASRLPADFDQTAGRMPATAIGYLQAVNIPSLLQLAHQHDVLLKLPYRPGQFVQREETLFLYTPLDRLNPDDYDDFRSQVVVGPERVGAQDVEAAINQLVEVAVRSLSPAINDPFTVMSCVDRLGASLSILAGRPMPSAYWYDNQGTLRLVADRLTFTRLLEIAFNQIREFGRHDTAVTIRILEALALIAAHVQHSSDREAVRQQAEMVNRGAQFEILEAWDQERIEQKYRLVLEVLDRKTS
jgi:uncharacterized membrane protein